MKKVLLLSAFVGAPLMAAALVFSFGAGRGVQSTALGGVSARTPRPLSGTIVFADQVPCPSSPGCGGASDIGAQINAAYQSLPAAGGVIYLGPRADGRCYTQTTPIVLAERANGGKYVTLQGIAAANAQANGGACLNFQPESQKAVAISLDYVPAYGGGFASSHGIRDLTLIDRNCARNGGCGNSDTGVALGASQSCCGGAQSGEISNVKIQGFGTGLLFNNDSLTKETPANSWGVLVRNASIIQNTVGVNFPYSPYENIQFIGGRIAVNGTGVMVSNGAGSALDLYFSGISFDSNQVASYDSSRGNGGEIVSFINCHFENPNQPNTHYIIAKSSVLNVLGGFILNDNEPNPRGDWTVHISGASAYIQGLEFYSAQIMQQAFLVDSGAKAYLAIHNNSNNTPTVGGNVYRNDVIDMSIVRTQPAAPYFGTGLRLGPVGNPCDETHGGSLSYTSGDDGVKDTVAVCAKDARGRYAWRIIY